MRKLCVSFLHLLYRSFTEKDRFSPRLLTTFATVNITGWLEYQVVILAHAGRPENAMLVQVILANLGLIGLLLGLGKLSDTYRDVKAGVMLTSNEQTGEQTLATSGTSPFPTTPPLDGRL